MTTQVLTPFMRRALGAGLGYAIDRRFGEPPDAVHPMIAVGNRLGRLESMLYRDRRANGVAHALCAVGAASAVGIGLRRLLGPFASTALTVAVSSSSKMLGSMATEVAAALEEAAVEQVPPEQDRLDAARHRLRSLVGRDTSMLDETQISRAVVESVAENTVDGVTATLFWAMVFGPPAVLAHRVTNTLDAMVGHRNERYQNFGWASARLDDVLNWLPARLTAGTIAVAATSSTRHVITVVRRDGAKHPSPNGGQVEAAVAGALGIELGGTNDYGGVLEVRGPLGDGRAPQPADIRAAVALTRRASDLVALFGLGIATSITAGQKLRR